jgi:hypothetical protein
LVHKYKERPLQKIKKHKQILVKLLKKNYFPIKVSNLNNKIVSNNSSRKRSKRR